MRKRSIRISASKVAERRSHFDSSDGERTEDTDPDERRDPCYSRGHDNTEASAPRVDDPYQGPEGGAPADRGGEPGDRVRRRCAGGLDFLTVTPALGSADVLDNVDIDVALFGLRSHQPTIRTVAADQLGVPAALDDSPLVENQDAVGADHARQPMREDQRRATGRQTVDRLLNRRLVFRVDRGESLVEDQDRRVAQQGAGDRQALALAAGEQHTALADHRGVTLRQSRDELVRVGVARRGFDFRVVGVGPAEPEVLLDRAVE